MRLFEHRLIDEERELTTRIENLLKFRCSAPFRELDFEMQELLHEQAQTMMSYQTILQKRLALLKDKP